MAAATVERLFEKAFAYVLNNLGNIHSLQEEQHGSLFVTTSLVVVTVPMSHTLFLSLVVCLSNCVQKQLCLRLLVLPTENQL